MKLSFVEQNIIKKCTVFLSKHGAFFCFYQIIYIIIKPIAATNKKMTSQKTQYKPAILVQKINPNIVTNITPISPTKRKINPKDIFYSLNTNLYESQKAKHKGSKTETPNYSWLNHVHRANYR